MRDGTTEETAEGEIVGVYDTGDWFDRDDRLEGRQVSCAQTRHYDPRRNDASKIRRAVEDADAIFLLTPFVANQVDLAARLVDAAKAAGVPRVVKLSALWAGQEPVIQFKRWHREAEELVEASGIAYNIPPAQQLYGQFHPLPRPRSYG